MKKNNTFQAIIFDMDGLLIDSEKMYYQTFAALAEKYGAEFTLEEYTAGFSGRSLKENIQGLIDMFTLPVTLDEAYVIVTDYLSNYDLRTIMLKPGARELIRYLKHNQVKVCLATSGNEKRARTILRIHGLETMFDAMAFKEDISNGKPAPDIFLKVCEKGGLSARDCLVLEDSEAGILAAERAGMKVICIPDLKYPGEEYAGIAWRILPDLYAVKELLEEER
ncbi:MAG: HAD family phosphatase [Solobacterium sp.]|nr:HAD family phosphatase [Solobacterium sp.]